MTGLGRWTFLPALAGLIVGQLRGQMGLAVLSLTVVLWIVFEWAWFTWRLWFEFPQLQFERLVNGRSESGGLLWAGRVVNVEVRVSGKRTRLSARIRITDVLPENVSVENSNNDARFLTRFRRAVFRYEARISGAGRIRLPGFRVILQDPAGFFRAERFVPSVQIFRVLPAYAEVGEHQPLVKRINSLPQHGVHRLQRSGMGSELLELREYVPGDPPKSIAWKVSARRDKLMTRQYESEVPVRLNLFLDGCISTRLGGFGQRLLDQLTYVGASVARSAISVGDPVGRKFLPVVEVVEHQIHRREVRGVCPQDDRLPGNTDGVVDPGGLRGDLFDSRDGPGGAFQRRRIGQLNVDQQIPLVLRRDETRRHRLEDATGLGEGVGQALADVDRDPAGLFAVDVLPRRGGHHRGTTIVGTLGAGHARGVLLQELAALLAERLGFGR